MIKRLFLLFFFSLITNTFLYSQCDLTLGNSVTQCVVDGEPAIIQLFFDSDAESPSWSVNTIPDGLNYELNQFNFNNSALLSFFDPGIYITTALDDGDCASSYEFEVFEPIGFETNITDGNYYLCNESVQIDFEILDQVSNESWYNFNNNGETIISNSPVFSEIFNEPGQFTISVEADDINGCRSRIDQEIVIIEGPSNNNTFVEIINDSEICISPSTNYTIGFQPNTNIPQSQASIISFQPDSLNIVSSNDPTINSEVFPIQVIIEFDNECEVISEFDFTHNIFYESLFEFEFDGTLCFGENITLNNISPNYNEQNASFFTWEIQGVDENLVGQEISFTYLEDGEYNWTLNYNNPDGCFSVFDTTIYVNVDLVNADFNLVGDSILCQNSEILTLQNLSTADDLVSYYWQATSGENTLTSDQQIPFFEIEVGTWDIELAVNSQYCSDTLLAEDLVTLIWEPKFEIEFDGILCNGEQITLTNTSPHFNDQTASLFSWDIEGIDEPIVGQEISFSYEQDGDYSWTLNFNDSQSCNSLYDTTISVNVDLIQPVLSDNISQLDCQLNSTLALSHQTILGPNDNIYVYEWAVTPESPEYDSSSNLTSNLESPNFQIISSQSQSYSISLTIDNTETGCSGNSFFENYFSLGGIIVEINPGPISLCENDQVFLQTNNIITSAEVEQYNYQWTVFNSNNPLEIIATSDLYNDSFSLVEIGNYDIILEVTDNQCESGDLLSQAIVYPNPIIEPILNNQLVCDLPFITNILVNNNSPSYGLDNFSWELSTGDSIISLNSGLEATSFSTLIESNNDYHLNLTVTNQTSQCISTDSLLINVESLNNSILSEDTLSCSPSIEIFTMENNLIESYQWMVIGSDGDSIIGINQSEITINLDPGIYDITLITETTNGCLSETIEEKFIQINSFDVSINPITDTICFQGSDSIIQTFTSSIIPVLEDIPYEIISYSWSIENSSSPVLINSDSTSADFMFSSPGVYTLIYTAEFFGSGENCTISSSQEINVGVDANLMVDELICVGAQFNAQAVDLDTWSSSHSYNWFTNSSELSLSDSINNSISISTLISLSGGLDTVYDLSVKVTNQVGCWVTKTDTIDVYEVIANFEISDSLLYCSNQQATLSSINNDHISSWIWSVEESSDTTTYQNIQNEFYAHTFSNSGYSSVALEITSEEGCSNQIQKDSVLLLIGYEIELISDSVFCFNDEMQVANTFFSEVTALYQTDSLEENFSTEWSMNPSSGSTLISENFNLDSVTYSFDETNTYDLLYSLTVGPSNCEIQKMFNVDIGVNVDIQEPITICLGNEFEVNSTMDTWSSDIIYEWSSNSEELQILQGDSSTAIIQTLTPIVPDIQETYDLSLIVSNSASCKDTTQVSVIAYEVVANFEVSDSLLHCEGQNSTLVSLQNQYISEWDWNIDENLTQTNYVSAQDSFFIHSYSNQGFSSTSLEITSEHGCSDQISKTDNIFLNTYELIINTIPDSICFQGLDSVFQSFSAEVIPTQIGLPYEIHEGTWTILSNSNDSLNFIQTNATNNSAEYQFYSPGQYTIIYSALVGDIDLPICAYSDTAIFNVGIDASISYNEIICVVIPPDSSESIRIQSNKNSQFTDPIFNAEAINLDQWSDSISYFWTSINSELNIENPTEISTPISTSIPLGPGIQDTYYISLEITNDVGCWKTQTESIEVYEVVADFDVSDSLLHCVGQDATLISLQNQYISLWEWNIDEFPVPTNYIDTQDSSYTHPYTIPGFSSTSLEITSEHGCSDQSSESANVFLNTYDLIINTIPDSICFQGIDTIFHEFSAIVIPNQNGFDYEIYEASWNIISNNNPLDFNQTNATNSSAEYEFYAPGQYTIVYSALIEDIGTTAYCMYTDTAVFNVGVDVSISLDDIICVGGLFTAHVVNLDNWSDSHNFNWTSSITELSITNSIDDTIQISPISPLINGLDTIYDLSVTVTNEVGCWYTKTENVDVYQLIPDFEVSDSLFHCGPQDFVVTSLNNTYIEQWDWSVYEHLSPSENLLNNEFSGVGNNFNLNDPSVYDIELSINSIHGCSDSYYADSIIIMNDLNLELEILDLDSTICFNGLEQVDKHFQINFVSQYDVPINIVEFSWEISPNIPVNNQDSLNLYLTFSESDIYTISYAVQIDNGSKEDCYFSETFEFQVGVIGSLNLPEIICVGTAFEIQADASIGIGEETTYQWNSESSVIFSNPNSNPTTLISQQNNIGGDEQISLPLSLTITNENGCFIVLEDSIEVYNLIADFLPDLSGELCAPIQLSFQSTYNNYVDSYQWNYNNEYYFGETEYFNASLDTSIFVFQCNEMANIDVGLSVISEHGCTDSINYENLVEVKKPYPQFSIIPEYSCEGDLISIVDSSILSSNILLTYGDLYLDSLYYNLEDTTQIYLSFPYDEIDGYEHTEQISLIAFLGECTSSFSQTATIYAKPSVNLSLNDSIGCPPFLVNFTDESNYVDSQNATYFWDFGDGTSSSLMNPEHTYSEPGSYQVFHSIQSNNGCYSDTILSTLIQVFDYPSASFTYSGPTEYCYNNSEIYFENTSEYETESILSNWSMNFDPEFTSTEENTTIQFESSGIFTLNLMITDLRGCSDITSMDINMSILDTLVPSPKINYVTVNDYSIEIFWDEDIDASFENLNIYHQNSTVNWNSIYNSTIITPNIFTHFSTPTYLENNYTIIHQDTCGYYSDSSIVHSTIVLSASSNEFETIDLSWSEYNGWNEVDYYSIYRSIDNSEYQIINTVDGNISFYQDGSLCNRDYSYYVIAHHPNQEFESRSNKIQIEPMFTDFTEPPFLISTSVYDTQNISLEEGNEYILTQWNISNESELSYYLIDRWDEYFGWVENFGIVSEPPFLDFDAIPSNKQYNYRIVYNDECGNSSPLSNLGSNIILTGEKTQNNFYLEWTPYIEWTSGIEYYSLEYFNQTENAFQSIEQIDADTLEYIETEANQYGTGTLDCYRIVAINANNNDLKSISNTKCFSISLVLFMPNAFTPNNDGTNDIFALNTNTFQEIEIRIFNRKKEMVFFSDQLDFKWEGTKLSDGSLCPQGNYIVDLIIKDFDGISFRKKHSLILLR